MGFPIQTSGTNVGTIQTLLIVIATYNEIENLPSLVDRLRLAIPTADILVIDDDSPDGTGRWCDQAIPEREYLSVIHRRRRSGLGSAAVAGFAESINRGYDLVATLDADFSHEPEALANMVVLINDTECIDTGVVIGSRYVVGGGTDGWPLFRRIASRVVNRFARCVLRLKTRDNSGAFRVYRVEVLRRLDPGTLKSTDFAYLEEVLWRLSRMGVRMREYPIVFRDRTKGQSKTSLLLGLKVFWQISLMATGRWK